MDKTGKLLRKLSKGVVFGAKNEYVGKKGKKVKMSGYTFSKVLMRWMTVPHTSKLSPAFT